MTQTTCILIDDEIRAMKRLENLLEKFDYIKVLAKESIPEHGIEKVLELKPDIVFVDVEMPRMNGFDVIKAIREKKYYPKFIFVTAYNQYAIKAIKQEAFDYLLKPVDIDELKKTLNRFKQKQSEINHVNLMEIPLFSSLSVRENEVLQYVIKGYTSEEIAGKLFISKTTIDSHRKKILEKTGAKKLTDLIIKAITDL